MFAKAWIEGLALKSTARTFIALALFWACLLPTGAHANSEISYFRIGTGGIAGTYYPIGGLIAQWVSNPPGSRPCDEGGNCGVPGLISVTQAANGSVPNVKAVGQGDLEFGFAQSNVTYWAYSGTEIFSKTESIRNLRAIGSLYRESFHLVARKGSGIASVQDLRGKRVSLDEPGSGTLVDARIILKAFGLSEKDLRPKYVKPEVAVEKIKNDQLDAYFIVAGYPTKSVKDLTSTIGAELIPISGPAIELVVRPEITPIRPRRPVLPFLRHWLSSNQVGVFRRRPRALPAHRRYR